MRVRTTTEKNEGVSPVEVDVTETHVPAFSVTVTRDGVEYSVFKVVLRYAYDEDSEGNHIAGSARLHWHVATLRPKGSLSDDGAIELRIQRGNLSHLLGDTVAQSLPGVV